MLKPPTPVGAGEDQKRDSDTADDRPDSPENQSRRRDPRNGQIRYVRLWISDLLGETYRLTPAALGAYIRIYCAIVAAQSPLPEADAANVAGATARTWKSVCGELVRAGVIDIIDGAIHDRRAQRAIDEFQTMSSRNRANVGKHYAVVNGGLEDAQ